MKKIKNQVPSCEEWNEQLTSEQREYSIYKILQSMDQRLSFLENRSWKGGAIQFFGCAFGGFIAVVTVCFGVVKAKIFK